MSLEALNIQATCEHPTPKGILVAARQTFRDGFIDLDVAENCHQQDLAGIPLLDEIAGGGKATG